MVIRAKHKKLENWFLAIFNGLLIFINASGWNVITTNNFFSDKTKTEQAKTSKQKADFLFFKNQIYWWRDNSVFIEKKHLKEENKELTEKVASLSMSINTTNHGLSNEDPSINGPGVWR